ncbi:hypothetical protein CSKR_106700 [Clonorchis sinensis]|uniref:Uncharacterized protein n=1 Tax=Clonorchis sinensis TaxID=79923 RepID=A0A3R7FMV5_CLOSI|nr:hypothetical protein CSKR_106700 [Clonorchis sinensis]
MAQPMQLLVMGKFSDESPRCTTKYSLSNCLVTDSPTTTYNSHTNSTRALKVRALTPSVTLQSELWSKVLSKGSDGRLGTKFQETKCHSHSNPKYGGPGHRLPHYSLTYLVGKTLDAAGTLHSTAERLSTQAVTPRRGSVLPRRHGDNETISEALSSEPTKQSDVRKIPFHIEWSSPGFENAFALLQSDGGS